MIYLDDWLQSLKNKGMQVWEAGKKFYQDNK